MLIRARVNWNSRPKWRLGAMPNLRKAVSLIIDRNQNIAIAYQGTTTPSTTMFVSYGGMDPFINAITDAGLAQ